MKFDPNFDEISTIRFSEISISKFKSKYRFRHRNFYSDSDALQQDGDGMALQENINEIFQILFSDYFLFSLIIIS
jgi:hypothetical protein